MNQKCSCGNHCIVNQNNIHEKISSLNPCNKCVDVSIKKFSPIKDLLKLDKLDNNYNKCDCGKRPLDIVMSHILKIMIEEKVVPENATLRRNSPIPLPAIYYSSKNPQFIGANSIILIHPKFTKNIPERLLLEVDEVKGVLKGNPQKTVGILEKGQKSHEYELLSGCDMRCDILRTLISNENSLKKIIINKKQSQNHIEVAPTSEEKLVKLYNYLKNSEKYNRNPEDFIAIDGMCGSGSIGIFLLLYGFKEVIFNDIWKKAIESTLLNLEINGFEYKLCENSEIIAIGDKFKVFNSAIENLNIKKVDLFVLDAYPQADLENLKKTAKKKKNS